MLPVLLPLLCCGSLPLCWALTAQMLRQRGRLASLAATHSPSTCSDPAAAGQADCLPLCPREVFPQWGAVLFDRLAEVMTAITQQMKLLHHHSDS